MKITRVISIVSIFTLVGCGGGSGGSTATPEPTVQPGVFLDSPVINIGYRTATRSGQTNTDGEYNYLPGESVTFFIGELELPTVLASGIVTPLDLAGTRDTRHVSVVNMIRLLQTLDDDGDPGNGITITDVAKGAATPVDFALPEADFAASSAVSTLIMHGGQNTTVTSLVSADQAVAHLEETLTQADQPYGPILGAWIVDSATLMFLPQGEYFAIQWKEDNGFVGFEKGAFEHEADVLRISVFQNNDGEALLCNEDALSTCEDEPYGSVISGDVLALDTGDDGVFHLNRQPLRQEGVVGVWKIDGASDSDGTLLIFLETGEYFGIEWGDEPIGFERGTYSYSNGSLRISTLQNNDGDTLLCNIPASSNCTNEPYDVTVNGDALTITDSEATGFSRRL